MEQQSRLTGAWAILTILALFALTVFVATGWYFLVAQISGNTVAAAIVAVAFSAVALVLLRVIAGQRAAKQIEAKKEFRWFYGWPALLSLFMISALGTVNAAFVLVEGASIVRQDINAVRTAYDNVLTDAKRRLPVASYVAKQEQLIALLAQLKVEIYNPNGAAFCGVGDFAEKIISRIREIVPEMPLIRGSGLIRPCDKAHALRVYSAYETSALATLAKDEAFLQARGPERTSYLARLDVDYQRIRNRLQLADAALTGFMGFASPNVQSPLAEAARDYASDRETYADLLQPQTTELPPQIDITSSQRLGSPAALFQILSKRIFTSNAWYYLVFAFGLDLGTTLLLTRIFVLRYRLDEQVDQSDPYVARGANPGFLWVNPPSRVRLG